MSAHDRLDIAATLIALALLITTVDFLLAWVAR